MTRIKPIQAAIVILICLGAGLTVGCDNNDEHPAEHPAEHPEGRETAPSLTKDQLADAIEAYVTEQSAKSDGYFIVEDDKTGEQLKLDKVHRKRLANVGKDKYFACADFTTDAGKVYDLDVFMTGTTKGNLTFSEFSVHKVAGKERYTWHEIGGVWIKKPIGEKAGAEHPKEHPKEQSE